MATASRPTRQWADTAPSKSKETLVNVLGGAVAGIGIALVGHPFDTIKVLLQTQSRTNPLYSGMVDATKKTVAAEGLGGLYKGVASPLAGMVVFNAAQFMLYGWLRDVFTNNGEVETLDRIAPAAAVAGGVLALIEGPQDFIKSQMQQQMLKAKDGTPPAYASTGDCVKKIYQLRGPLGYFQGFHATVVRNVPSVAMYFTFYEGFKQMFAKRNESGKATGTQMFMAGYAGGVAYWCFTYPLDVIKSAMQTDALLPAERTYKSYMDVIRKLWAEGGAARFYTGIAPCLLRSGPANATGFLLMEATKSALL